MRSNENVLNKLPLIILISVNVKVQVCCAVVVFLLVYMFNTARAMLMVLGGVFVHAKKKSFLVYDVTGNYLASISFFFNFQATYPTKEVKWPLKRSINLKWPKRFTQQMTSDVSGVRRIIVTDTFETHPLTKKLYPSTHL